MGLFSDFFKVVQKGVNLTTGGSYRNVYFSRNTSRYHRCNACGKTLDREIPREVTIDHIIPQKCYGTNAITNLQVLCQTCNSRKRDKLNSLAVKYSGQALARELRNSLGY